MSGSYFDETDITAARAIELVASGRAWLLDVREQYEWDAGHAPQAHHIPMHELAARQHELPDDQQIVVVCHVGVRSELVRDALLAADYPAANVVGGMDAWAQSGGAVSTGGGDAGRAIDAGDRHGEPPTRADGIMDEGGA